MSLSRPFLTYSRFFLRRYNTRIKSTHVRVEYSKIVPGSLWIQPYSTYVPQIDLKEELKKVKKESAEISRADFGKEVEFKIGNGMPYNPVSVDTSIKYMESQEFQNMYEGQPVWKFFRRNFKGQKPPTRTRKQCVRANMIATGSPCPICRDPNLVVDYKNIALLKHFIHEGTGEILPAMKTNVCRQQMKKIQIAVAKARSYGTIESAMPHVTYDYREYKLLAQKKLEKENMGTTTQNSANVLNKNQ